MIQTLKEAVDELNSLPNPIEVLTKYPNRREFGRRCTTCPVSAYLGDRIKHETWVSKAGQVCLGDGTGLPRMDTGVFQLGSSVIDAIYAFDNSAT